jgi:hypothetical protein
VFHSVETSIFGYETTNTLFIMAKSVAYIEKILHELEKVRSLDSLSEQLQP